MAEILGIGLSHYPGLVQPDEGRNHQLTRALKSGRLTPEQMDPANWPEAMRLEYGDDQGYSAHKKVRARLEAGFRAQRAALDAFNPDFVLIWGDDQYENFKEDVIRPSVFWPTTRWNAVPSPTTTAVPGPTSGASLRTKTSPIKSIPPPGN